MVIFKIYSLLSKPHSSSLSNLISSFMDQEIDVHLYVMCGEQELDSRLEQTCL